MLLNLLVDLHLSPNLQKALDSRSNLICKFPLKRLPIISECLVVSLIQLIHTLSQNLLHYFSNNRLGTCFEHQFFLYNTHYVVLDVSFPDIQLTGFIFIDNHKWLLKFLHLPMENMMPNNQNWITLMN